MEFKRVEGPAELQLARYCMSQMHALRSSSSKLYMHSFMPMATCEIVGSELRSVTHCSCSNAAASINRTSTSKNASEVCRVCRFGAVWFESSLCATHFACIDMRLHASLAHERRVAVAIAGWMQLLSDLNMAALRIFAIEVPAKVRMAYFGKGFPYVLWELDRYTYHYYLWLYAVLSLMRACTLCCCLPYLLFLALSNACNMYRHSCLHTVSIKTWRTWSQEGCTKPGALTRKQ